MAKTEENVQWLQENQIHVLFNELATDMLASKPDDVLSFICSWGNKKKESKAGLSRRASRTGSCGNLTDHTAGDTQQQQQQQQQQPSPATEQIAGYPSWRPSPDELAERHAEPNEMYALQEVIGEGHYGKVHKAVREDTGDIVAVKKIPIEGDWVELEITHLQHCASPHVVGLIKSHYDRQSDSLWIVMEMLGTSLATVAEAAGPRAFTEPMLTSVCREILYGLNTIHELQRVHLDVKPGNLLLTPDHKHIKIADFGTMQVIGADCVQLGDFAFMSPEVAYSSGTYEPGSDIWSLGISCLYLADGEAPLWREKPDLLMFIHRETCMKPSLWEPLRWSREFSDVLSYCFMKYPTERPGAGSLLRSTWIQSSPEELILPPPLNHENGYE